MRTRVGLLVAAVAALLIGLVLFLGHIPKGRVGISSAGQIVDGPFSLIFGSAAKLPASGSASGRSSPPGREGSLVPLQWDATWSLRRDMSPELARGLRDHSPEAALPQLVDESLATFARERSADALATAGVLAEAESVLVTAFAERGLDARVRLHAESSGKRAFPDKALTVRSKVVLIGIDAMDWRIADPLLKAGRLPNLKALLDRGARGELRSARPMLSPLLWTTMVTGRRPEDHGVCDFLAIDPSSGARVPITSGFREVPALWNIATEAGLESGFVAWWATWPAEPVRGALVSDRLAYTLGDFGAAPAAKLAHPPAFEKEVLALRVKPADVNAKLVESFAQGAPAGDERVAHLRRILAGALTYHAAGLRLLDRGMPLTGIYYEMIDQVGHRFMHLAPPKRSDVSEADYQAFSGTIDAAYELQDRLLGEIAAKVPADGVLIVVSDHGFLSGPDRPPGSADVAGQPARWHRLLGVFLAAGPGVKAGEDLGVVGVEDIAPTVLHLLGLPVALDMPGRPKLGLDKPVLAVPSYDAIVRLAHEAPPPADARLNAAALEELQALGYVGASSQQAAADLPKGEATARGKPGMGGLLTTANHHLNAATSLFEAGRFEDAGREARAAIERQPSLDAWGLVSQVLEAQGDLPGALDAARRAASIAPSSAEATLRQVQLLLRMGKTAEASRLARVPSNGAASGGAAAAPLLTAQAMALRASGDSVRAMGLLRHALELDPSYTPAIAVLLPLAEENGGLAGLEPILRDALSRNPGLPRHREALGALELAGGRADEAIVDLRAALELDPAAIMARARLALALMLKKDMDAALIEAQAVRAASPPQPDAWLMIGTVFGRGDQLRPALECLVKARELGASGAGLDVAEAVTRVQLGDEAGAVRVLSAGLARHPNDSTLRELEAEFQRQGVSSKEN